MFIVNPGQNTIQRSSTESSLTIPFERTFRNVDENRPISGDSLEQFNFCGCGWPQHLLIPKGSKAGFPMDLFIMISDYTGDAVSFFFSFLYAYRRTFINWIYCTNESIIFPVYLNSDSRAKFT